MKRPNSVPGRGRRRNLLGVFFIIIIILAYCRSSGSSWPGGSCSIAAAGQELVRLEKKNLWCFIPSCGWQSIPSGKIILLLSPLTAKKKKVSPLAVIVCGCIVRCIDEVLRCALNQGLQPHKRWSHKTITLNLRLKDKPSSCMSDIFTKQHNTTMIRKVSSNAYSCYRYHAKEMEMVTAKSMLLCKDAQALFVST